MDELLQQLHDIEGVGYVRWWPLAIGWWILAMFTIISLGIFCWLVARKIAFKRSWKNDILGKLAKLEKDLSDPTARQAAVMLSEYLRRIALRRYSRKECAGLHGDAWLKWLTAHDPKNFDWIKNGTVLIAAPYAPVNYDLPSDQVKDLIQATREWVY